MVDVTSLYWTTSGKRYADIVAALEAVDAPTMRRLIVNEHYNDFCREHSNPPKEREDEFLNGKPIPYMGWFWRATNFADKRISIGFSDGYVGVMENNKWDYHERYMTIAEVDQFVSLLDDAISAGRQGGSLDQIVKNKWDAIAKIGPWMQSLPRILEPV